MNIAILFRRFLGGKSIKWDFSTLRNFDNTKQVDVSEEAEYDEDFVSLSRFISDLDPSERTNVEYGKALGDVFGFRDLDIQGLTAETQPEGSVPFVYNAGIEKEYLPSSLRNTQATYSFSSLSGAFSIGNNASNFSSASTDRIFEKIQNALRDGEWAIELVLTAGSKYTVVDGGADPIEILRIQDTKTDSRIALYFDLAAGEIYINIGDSMAIKISKEYLVPVKSTLGLNHVHLVLQRTKDSIQLLADGEVVIDVESALVPPLNTEDMKASTSVIEFFNDEPEDIGLLGIAFYTHAFSQEKVNRKLIKESWIPLYRAVANGTTNLDQANTLLFTAFLSQLETTGTEITSAPIGEFSEDFTVEFSNIESIIENEFSLPYKYDFLFTDSSIPPEGDFVITLYSDETRTQEICEVELADLVSGTSRVFKDFAPSYDNTVEAFSEAATLYGTISSTLEAAQADLVEIRFDLIAESPSGKVMSGLAQLEITIQDL